MTRYLYGAGGDAEVNSSSTGLPYASTTANVYNQRTGGVQVTDLQNEAGNAISQVTSDANGQFAFYGPDAMTATLWLDLGTAHRWAMRPVDIAGVATAAANAIAATTLATTRANDWANRVFTAKSTLPKNTNDPMEQGLADALDALVIPRFASSGARNTAFPSPADGDRCYRTDLDRMERYDGTAAAWLATEWGAWTTAVPVWGVLSGTAPTVGNATLTARYMQLGKMVVWTGKLVFGSTSNGGSGVWYMSFPVTPSSALTHRGVAEYLVPASNNYVGEVIIDSTNAGAVFCVKTSTNAQSFANVSNTVPVASVTNNALYWTVTYEAA